jgi:hypothetical protein
MSFILACGRTGVEAGSLVSKTNKIGFEGELFKIVTLPKG